MIILIIYDSNMYAKIEVVHAFGCIATLVESFRVLREVFIQHTASQNRLLALQWLQERMCQSW
jgi:hypothetical protein